MLGDYNAAAGAWIRFNPLDGQGCKNANVTDYRYALVESDTMDLEQQNALIHELELPVACLVYSGGKSIHAIVRIEAADYTGSRASVRNGYGVNSQEAREAGGRFKKLYTQERAREGKQVQKATGYTPGTGVNERLSPYRGAGPSTGGSNDRRVLDRATAAYLALDGANKMNLKTAEAKAAIVNKAMDGELLSGVDVRALDLQNAQKRAAFGEATGMRFVDEGDADAVKAFNARLGTNEGQAQLARQIQDGVLRQRAETAAAREARELAKLRAQQANFNDADRYAGDHVRVDNAEHMSYDAFAQAFRERSGGALSLPEETLRGYYNRFLGDLGRQLGEPTVNYNGETMNDESP